MRIPRLIEVFVLKEVRFWYDGLVSVPYKSFLEKNQTAARSYTNQFNDFEARKSRYRELPNGAWLIYPSDNGSLRIISKDGKKGAIQEYTPEEKFNELTGMSEAELDAYMYSSKF